MKSSFTFIFLYMGFNVTYSIVIGDGDFDLSASQRLHDDVVFNHTIDPHLKEQLIFMQRVEIIPILIENRSSQSRHKYSPKREKNHDNDKKFP